MANILCSTRMYRQLNQCHIVEPGRENCWQVRADLRYILYNTHFNFIVYRMHVNGKNYCCLFRTFFSSTKPIVTFKV